MVVNGGPDLDDAVNAAPVVGAWWLLAVNGCKHPTVCELEFHVVFENSLVWHREVSQHGPARRETREAFGPHF
jgi:hypothetical protein